MTLQDLLRGFIPAPLQLLGDLGHATPTQGSLWQGTPISDFLSGPRQAYAADLPASNNQPTQSGSALGNILKQPQTGTPTIVNTGGGGGGGGNAPTNNGGNQNFGVDLAMQAYNAARQQANDVRSSGQRTFQTLLDSINAFRNRSKDLYNSADQQITNSSAEQLGSNARTAAELAGTARARGRALGLGDSSKFNLQNKVDANLASTQGSTLANKGENQAANTNQFNQRQDQAQTQEGQANNYLQDINNSANQVESAGVNNYGGALNNLLQRAQALQTLQPLNAGGLSQFNPDTSGIVNTLNGLLGGLGGTQTPVGGQDVGNAFNPQDIFSLLKNKRVQGVAN